MDNDHQKGTKHLKKSPAGPSPSENITAEVTLDRGSTDVLSILSKISLERETAKRPRRVLYLHHKKICIQERAQSRHPSAQRCGTHPSIFHSMVVTRTSRRRALRVDSSKDRAFLFLTLFQGLQILAVRAKTQASIVQGFDSRETTTHRSHGHLVSFCLSQQGGIQPCFAEWHAAHP